MLKDAPRKYLPDLAIYLRDPERLHSISIYVGKDKFISSGVVACDATHGERKGKMKEIGDT